MQVQVAADAAACRGCGVDGDVVTSLVAVAETAVALPQAAHREAAPAPAATSGAGDRHSNGVKQGQTASSTAAAGAGAAGAPAEADIMDVVHETAAVDSTAAAQVTMAATAASAPAPAVAEARAQHKCLSLDGEAMQIDEVPDGAPTTSEDNSDKQHTGNGNGILRHVHDASDKQHTDAANGVSPDGSVDSQGQHAGPANGVSPEAEEEGAAVSGPNKRRKLASTSPPTAVTLAAAPAMAAAAAEPAAAAPAPTALTKLHGDTPPQAVVQSTAGTLPAIARPAAAAKHSPTATPAADAVAAGPGVVGVDNGAAASGAAARGEAAQTAAAHDAAGDDSAADKAASASRTPAAGAADADAAAADGAASGAPANVIAANGITADGAATADAVANSAAAGGAVAADGAPPAHGDAAAATASAAGGAAAANAAAAAPSSVEATVHGAAAGPSNQAAAPLSEAEQNVKDTLRAYKACVKGHMEKGRAKPDMIAFKELRESWTPALSHGHVPGVPVGMEVLGRGEVAILGVHTKMMSGIDSRADDPKGAYAIVLSGGYKDDDDSGSRFWYTGEGGQGKGKKQSKDQVWAKGNLALQRSKNTGTPVRVVRAKVGDAKERLYVYDGLYKVVEAKMEPSSDGPKVCRFLMEGIPGDSRVSTQVAFNALSKTQWARILLPMALAGPLPQSKKRSRAFKPPRKMSRQEILRDICARRAAGEHLLCEDLANGTENVPIPLWNDVDEKSKDMAAPAFTYTADYQFASTDAQALAERAETHFREACPISCGVQWMNDDAYNEDGLVVAYVPSGIMECDMAEPCCSGQRRCAKNTLVEKGITLPLEVFKTKGKGYGVRCTVDIPVGSFICCYIGLVMTSDEAEERREQDYYLFDLDHYLQLNAVEHARIEQATAKAARAAERAKAAAAREATRVQRAAAREAAVAAAKAAVEAAGQEWQGQQEEEMEEEEEEQQQQGEEEENEVVEELNPNLPPLPDELAAGDHLVIDASTDGNVGRFINHSCKPNCIVQPVLTKLCRSQALYYVAVVAQADIPKMTELTYDYGYRKLTAGGQATGRLRCNCGAAECVGILL